LNARYDERTLASGGALLMATALLAIPHVPGLTAAMVVLGVLAVGQGLVTPTLSSLLSLESSADERGGTLGLGQSLAAGARAIGPLAAGWLFDRGMALPYVLSALLLVMTVWLILGVKIARPARSAALAPLTSSTPR
jgi:DHA1 family tetracycline resistance protein-like MFS transporter